MRNTDYNLSYTYTWYAFSILCQEEVVCSTMHNCWEILQQWPMKIISRIIKIQWYKKQVDSSLSIKPSTHM